MRQSLLELRFEPGGEAQAVALSVQGRGTAGKVPVEVSGDARWIPSINEPLTENG